MGSSYRKTFRTSLDKESRVCREKVQEDISLGFVATRHVSTLKPETLAPFDGCGYILRFRYWA